MPRSSARLSCRPPRPRRPPPIADRPATAADVRACFAACSAARTHGRRPRSCSLGGDSLSYVELSLASRRRLGRAARRLAQPRTSAELAERSPAGRRAACRSTPASCCGRWRSCSIVGTHANLFTLLGGAHLLLAVAGSNFARFQLGRRRRGVPGCARTRGAGPGRAPVRRCSSVPSRLTHGMYDAAHRVFLNGLARQRRWTDAVAVLVPRGVHLGRAGALAPRRRSLPSTPMGETAPFVAAPALVGVALVVRSPGSGSRPDPHGALHVGICSVRTSPSAGCWSGPRRCGSGRRLTATAVGASASSVTYLESSWSVSQHRGHSPTSPPWCSRRRSRPRSACSPRPSLSSISRSAGYPASRERVPPALRHRHVVRSRAYTLLGGSAGPAPSCASSGERYIGWRFPRIWVGVALAVLVPQGRGVLRFLRRPASSTATAFSEHWPTSPGPPDSAWVRRRPRRTPCPTQTRAAP